MKTTIFWVDSFQSSSSTEGSIANKGSVLYCGSSDKYSTGISLSEILSLPCGAVITIQVRPRRLVVNICMYVVDNVLLNIEVSF